MKEINRRSFLKSAAAGLSLAGVLGTKKAKASDKILSEDRVGVLVDTDACVGCRHCEYACKKAHNIPTKELESYYDNAVFKEYRKPKPDALTVVNQFENEKNSEMPVYVKQQCMHCERPACVSACIVGAIEKHEDGSVTWDDDKCIGCRYCMVACPYQMPTFDYDRSIDPDIRKCDFCFERRKTEALPACVNICPNEALFFGKRSELLSVAKKRIKRKSDVYVNHIYGEHEVGGTSWMYIASKDFDKLRFPKLQSNPAPGISETIQHGIFAYFVPPVTLYALLGTMMYITRRRKENKEAKEKKELEKTEGGEK